MAFPGVLAMSSRARFPTHEITLRNLAALGAVGMPLSAACLIVPSGAHDQAVAAPERCGPRRASMSDHER